MSRLDPRFALAGLVCVGSLCLLLDRSWSLAALFVVGLAAFVRAPVPGRARGLMLLVLIGVAWSNLLSQGFFHVSAVRTAWWVVIEPEASGLLADGLVLSREGVIHGLIQSLRFGTLLLLGAAVTAGLSSEQLLRGLSALRLPPILAFSAAVALRAVPDLLREWAQIRAAARLRGLGASLRSPRSLLWEPLLLRPLIARLVVRSQQLALATRARGLGFDAPPGLEGELPMPGLQRVALIGLVGITGLAVAGRLLLWARGVGWVGSAAWYGWLDAAARLL